MIRSLTVALLSIAALVLAASTYASRRPDSGISGRVVYGPTCPVQRRGQVCERSYRAPITIRIAATGRFVARVWSSSAGRFRLALRPGSYRLIPLNGSPLPRSSPQTVRVRAHRYTSVLIRYDSGIR